MRSRTLSGALAAAALLLAPAAAWAHPGAAPQPHDLWRAWTLEPAVLAGLALTGWGYARGTRARRRRGARPWPRVRAAAFWGGWLAVALALVSPVDAIAESLFAVHMVQHILLTMVAPPLLVVGDAGTALLWALPLGGRRRVGRLVMRGPVRAAWRALRHPATAWTLHVLALWIWHVPALYDAAVRRPVVHVAEHLCFFWTALLFWFVLLAPHRRARMAFGPAVLYLFTAGVQATALGALLALARHPWFTAHLATTGAWGLTPLEDQQLAGLIMWVPAGVVYLWALAARFLEAMEEREEPGLDRRVVPAASLGGAA